MLKVGHMYREAAELYGELIRLVLFVVLTVAAFAMIEFFISLPSFATTIVEIVLWALLAFEAHARILLPVDREKRDDLMKVVKFALRSTGLGLLIVVPLIGLAIYLAFSEFNDRFFVEDPLDLIIVMSAVSGVLFIVVFAMVGTWLPAYVAQQKLQFSAAFIRGKSTFFRVAGKLIIGPVLIYAFAYAGFVFFGIINPGDSENTLPGMMSMFLVFLIFNAVQAFAVIMTAWILSHTFLDTEGVVLEAPDADLSVSESN